MNNQILHEPLVSVCIPTYNTEEVIIQTLNSAINQTYRNLEILIVDNASTDSTYELVKQVSDPRIVLHRNESNLGGEQNWNRCIKMASGDYIIVFHNDDVYMPQMIEKQIKAFQTNPSIGAVFTQATIINDRDEKIGECNLLSRLSNKGIYQFPELFICVLEYGNFLLTPSCMVKGQLYKELVPFDFDRFGASSDLDMWFRILERQPVAILDEKLMCYRISNKRGAHLDKRVGTEETQSFIVLDHYLSTIANEFEVSPDTLGKYEFRRALDKIMRALKYTAKGDPIEGKKLLRGAISVAAFRGATRNILKPKLLSLWICGILILISGPLMGHLAKILYRILRIIWERRLA
ncbi:glycosyltransferase family 2 protein [Chloroflexota bacterium]